MLPTLSHAVLALCSFTTQDVQPATLEAPQTSKDWAAGARGIPDDIVAQGIPGASAALVLPDGQLVTATAGFADAAAQVAMTPTHQLLVGSEEA